MEELDESVPVAEELLPCKVCGRNFFPKVLKKHMLICQKAAVKKRRVFDSSRQRAEGTDISTVKPIKPKPEPPKKVSNWRRKHEDFIATIRAAKGLNQVMKDGGPLPPPPPPSYDPDYIQCPYCQRRFGENAADRHIKFCKEQASRISNKAKFSGSEKAKPAAKTQYKPAPAKKASPVPSTSSVSSSRLPQRPVYGQGGGTGMSGTKSPVGSVKNVAASASFSPPRPNTGGVTSPPSGVNTKPKGVVAPSSLKSTTYGGGMSKKKTYTTNSFNSRVYGSHMTKERTTRTKRLERNDVKNDSDVDYSAQGTKFCHECGTKYPVDWAKFCCECGVKRMCI